MSKVKNEHYIPQFYLRKFATSAEQIHVFDKFKRKPFVAHVRNLASETGFYDLGPEVQRAYEDHYREHPEQEAVPFNPKSIENALSELESHYAPVFDAMLASIETSGVITEEQRAEMSVFLALQMLRSPEFRRTYMEMGKKFLTHASKELLARSPYKEYQDSVEVTFDESLFPLEHARLMMRSPFVETYSAHLAHHIWRVGVNDTGQPLYTSDEPIVLQPHLPVPYYGIGTPGIEVVFPLTPRHLLTMKDRSFFSAEASADRTTFPLGGKDIESYNSLQVVRSYRHVFCSAPRFGMAEKVCDERPEVCAPRAQRVTVESVGSDLIHVGFEQPSTTKRTGQRLQVHVIRQMAIPRRTLRREQAKRPRS